MPLHEPSWTSMACARARALHTRLDGKPWIYEDKLAPLLVDLEGQIADGLSLDQFRTPISSPTRATFVVRERYVEDELAAAVLAGTSQFVILGAGLNTLAYTGSNLSQSVNIFEVDHPATQAWKRNRLQELGIPEPSNLTFVSVDFESESLASKLCALGFDMTAPAMICLPLDIHRLSTLVHLMRLGDTCRDERTV